MAVGAESRCFVPRTIEGIQGAFEQARREGRSLGLRGGGNSYGDASVNGDGHVLDIRAMNRILDWNPGTGVADLEPGVTIEQLWKHILPDGWWPRVVSGTMFPTVAGAAAMNIHGKNNFAVGTFGDAVLDFDLVAPNGDQLRCSREENPDVFHAAIGGFGMLGSFSRIRLQTKKVHSGNVRVTAIATHHIHDMMDWMEAHRDDSDYLVGWVDCFGSGDQLGRGLIHQAHYLEPGDDPDPAATLALDHQELPANILGLFPKEQVWRVLRLLCNDPGMRALNAAKFVAGRLEGMRDPYLQSHAGFSFLLDYVPNWKWAYGRKSGQEGLIQYQVFLPKETARETYAEILRSCQEARLVPYLGVFKRHRPDPFWLTHAVDGWSFAMDFRVHPGNRERLWKHCHGLTDRVLDAGGRFYFAKDLLVRPGDAQRFFPKDRLDAFFELKQHLDPQGLLQTNLSRRVFPKV